MSPLATEGAAPSTTTKVMAASLSLNSRMARGNQAIDGMVCKPVIIEPTADFAYARLELTQSKEPTGYGKADLKRWLKTARDWEKKGDVFLYFISGAKERNPAAAMAMLDLLKA